MSKNLGRFFLLSGSLSVALFLLAACAGVPTGEPPGPTIQVEPTEPVVRTPVAATTTPVVTATPLVETRLVELEWTPRMRLGDSDVVRLALLLTEEGYTVTVEFPGHQVDTREVPVERPGGYRLISIARLDGVGFDISPLGDQERYLPLGEDVSWRWTLTPRAAGQQRLSISLALRWEQLQGQAGIARESLIYARSLDVQVLSFFGLTRTQAMTTGFFGLILGGGLSLFALIFKGGASATLLRAVDPNRALLIEPHPNLALSNQERALLQSLFRQYDRLILEQEFLSGYSGARTFLALPIRPDGRLDAHTIVKIGMRNTIQREFENYETFVKDTLPPITARIQRAPVTVRGAAQGALRYTFIGEPGTTPVSLRQALQSSGDPSLLYKLFDTFGPNWWMQRKAYTFRLAQEYDRMLPTYYVLEPDEGHGRVLDGRLPPAEANLQIGDLVTLRHFPQVELRADERSYSLKGKVNPGLPPIRVRWLSKDQPLGATGRVVATRWSILKQIVSGFDLLGLPDPFVKLPDLLAENVIGTQSTIHGDLNLENVLVGPGDFVWLIDFAQTRDAHPLYDFAHLEAEIIAHVLADTIHSPAEYLDLLKEGDQPLLAAMHDIAGRCLFNPGQPSEYNLALFMACLGALKFVNLSPFAKNLLFLNAAWIGENL